MKIPPVASPVALQHLLFGSFIPTHPLSVVRLVASTPTTSLSSLLPIMTLIDTGCHCSKGDLCVKLKPRMLTALWHVCGEELIHQSLEKPECARQLRDL